MKKTLVIFIVLFVIMTIKANSFQVSTTELEFGSVIDGGEVQGVFTITNLTNNELNIDIIEDSEQILLSNDNVSLFANEEIEVTVTFSPETNINYDTAIFIVDEARSEIQTIEVSAQGTFSESIYNTTYNKYDFELKNAISAIIRNHTSISYEDARIEIFGYIDNDNGQVRCVYTDEWYNCSPGSIPNWNQINTEHTWPQSMGATGTAKSDLFHLFPTDSQANSVRGNLPFGEVSSSNWSDGGSKRGSNSSGTTVFEPRDDHKGDVARAMFYFSIRYNNPNNFLNSAGQQEVLRNWYYQDPVSDYELYRAQEIEEVQNKPNPFIEHPELLDRLASITSNTSTSRYPDMFIPVDNFVAYAYDLNNAVTLSIPVVNNGTDILQVNNIVSSSDVFNNISFPNSIGAGDTGIINFDFNPTEETTYNGSLSISSNDPNNSTWNIDLQGVSEIVSNYEDTVPVNNLTVNNYPNPFRSKSNIKIDTKSNVRVNVEIYNIKGQKVKSFMNQNNRSGHLEIVWNGCNENDKELPSGVYLVKVSSEGKCKTSKLLHIK